MAASGFQFFERDLKLAVASIEPDAIRRELAAFARKSVADVVSSGQAPADYERFVNGRAGAVEESVQLPGPIVYVFSNWKLVIEAALAELVRRSPKRSGKYARSFLVVVGGRVVSDFMSIPSNAEVVILNFQPYTRKMEVGQVSPSGDRHFDATGGVIKRRFGSAFRVEIQFVSVSGGLHPQMPYILKRGGRGRRKSQRAGQPISYPALVLSAA